MVSSGMSKRTAAGRLFDLLIILLIAAFLGLVFWFGIRIMTSNNELDELKPSDNVQLDSSDGGENEDCKGDCPY